MKKSILHFSLLFAIGLQNSFAQVPGYQGKRFSLGYNASSFFYFDNLPTDEGVSGVIESTKISYKSEFYLNYALSRKVTGGFSFYFGKQNGTFTKEGIPDNGYYNYGYYEPLNNKAVCKLSMYELHFQFFRKNFIAPVGLYHLVSIGIVKYGLATSDNKLKLYSPNTPTTLVLNGPTDPYTAIKLGYAIGKTNPIGHHFYINTSVGVNFFRGGDSAFIKTSINEQNYILANFNKNLRTHNLLEVKIGLGWLAF